MKIHRVGSLHHTPDLSHTAVTVGSFDGVHRGHRAVLSYLCKAAKERGLESVIITLEPHHRIYFKRESSPFLLTSLDEKLSLLRSTDLDHVVVLPFDHELSGMPAAQFLGEIVSERLGGSFFLAGYDHAVGRDQVRGMDAIARIAKEHGIHVETAPPLSDSELPVSSTRVRSAVMRGDMEEAAQLLGDAYLLSGVVVHGDARGRDLGYPTANIEVSEPYKLVPPPGVYVATAEILDQQHNTAHSPFESMLYVGSRPTFGESRQVIELFLMDWRGDLYGQHIRVRVLHRLRGDKKFDSVDALVDQIQIDESQTREYFGRSPQGTGGS